MARKVAFGWLIAGLLGVAGATPASATVPAAVAQDAKAELEKRQAALKEAGKENDAAAWYELATWAEQNNLKTDSKRILRQVIKIDPDHAEARAALGYEKFEGKWLTKREIDREKQKAEEAEKLKLGLKKWKDQWVPAADYEKLEKGLVKVTVKGDDGKDVEKWVTTIEKERLDKGMVLHENQWLTKEEVEHLKAGEFKIDEKWVSKDEADRIHSDFTKPWELEGDLVALQTTCPYEFAKKVLKHGDLTVKQAYRILGLEVPKDLPKIPIIMVTSADDYKALGGQVQDNNDATASTELNAFVYTDANTGKFVGVAIYNTLEGAKPEDNDRYSLMNARHAVAAAAIRNLTYEEPLPYWFMLGVSTYCERFWDPIDGRGIHIYGKWSYDNLQRKGGLISMKQFFDNFTVSKQSAIQTGLVVSYLLNGTHPPKLDDQWKKCLEALKEPKKKGLAKDFVKLEVQFGKDGDKEIEAFATSL